MPRVSPLERITDLTTNTPTGWLGPVPLPEPAPLVSVAHQAEGRYQITLPNDPTWFRVKLTKLPGFQLYDDAGNALPLYNSTPHLLGYGQGVVTLIYRRPAIIWVSYACAFLCVLYPFVSRRQKTQ